MKKKLLGTVYSTLISENLAIGLKLRKQNYLMILPQNILQQFGINSEELRFDLAVNDSDKLILVGPKIANQLPSKSDVSNIEQGDLVA